MTAVSGKVMMMAGGTGGHVFPALAVADHLRNAGIEIVWMGTAAGIEARLVPDAGYEHEWIPVAGLRGKGKLTLFLAPLKLLRAVWTALAAIKRQRPNVVVGMGGFASGPGGLAARLLRLPLVIHEQNASAGMTNRVLSHIATRVLQAFPNTFSELRKPETVGNPVRQSFLSAEPVAQRFSKRGAEPMKLLVIGGSLGAKALNEMVPAALALLPKDYHPVVLHQGGRTVDVAKAAYEQSGVAADVRPFIDDVTAAMSAADLVICRSGASTVAELSAVGVAALLVPFPFAVDDHQTANGQYLVDAGAARLIQERDLDAEKLAAQMSELFADRKQLQAMAENARKLSPMHSTQQIADACLALMEAA